MHRSGKYIYQYITQCFFHKNGNRRFQYVVIGYKDTYFVRDHSDAPQKYSDADIIKMLEYLIDNIFVEFGGRIFQQTIGIPMGTNCAPLLADLFLYSYEAEFVQSLLQAGKRHLAQQFNFTYHYENMPIQIYLKIYHQKNENFQIKISDIFLISTQNTDYGYSLEPPRRGGSNEYHNLCF